MFDTIQAAITENDAIWQKAVDNLAYWFLNHKQEW